MNKTYFPVIDILRFVAVTAVVLNHLSKKILPNGFLGVDVFFIISGFVVTYSVLNRPYDILDFFSRRIKRLFPMYYLTFILGMVFTLLYYNEPEQSIFTGLSSLIGSSNIYLYLNQNNYFNELTINNLFLHTWSLGVEEQFYFIVAFIYALNFQSKILITVLVLVLISFSCFMLAPISAEANFYLIFNRFWQIGLGILAYFCFKNKIYINKIFFAPLFLLITSTFYFLSKNPQFATLLISFSTFSLLLCQTTHLQNIHFMGNKFLIYLGKKSYVIYLIHWPLLLAIKTFSSISSQTIVYYFIIMILVSLLLFPLESFIQQKITSISKEKTIISFILIMIFSFYFGYLFKDKDFTSISGLKRISFSIADTKIWNTKKCVLNKNNINNEFKIEDCKLNAQLKISPGQSIYLYGDSYAQQIVPTFLNAQQNYNFFALSASGCPPFRLSPNDQINNPHCLTDLSELIAKIDFKTNDKFILSYSMIYFYLLKYHDQNNNIIPLEQLFESAANSINMIAERLKLQGVKFYFIGGIPTSTILNPFECIQPWKNNKVQCSKIETMNLQDTKIRRSLELKFVSKLKNVEYIKLFDYVQENLWGNDFYENYHDYQHLSQVGATKIRDFVLKQI